MLSVAPQRESRVAGALAEHGIGHYLPQINVRRVYASKKITVERPIYEGYLFACYANDYERGLIMDAKHLIDVLPVHRMDQEGLVSQLAALELALAHDPWLDVVDWQKEGRAVQVVRGPLLGLEGKIIKRRGRDVLMVGVEMFGQCVELNIDAVDVSPLN